MYFFYSCLQSWVEEGRRLFCCAVVWRGAKRRQQKSEPWQGERSSWNRWTWVRICSCYMQQAVKIKGQQDAVKFSPKNGGQARWKEDLWAEYSVSWINKLIISLLFQFSDTWESCIFKYESSDPVVLLNIWLWIRKQSQFAYICIVNIWIYLNDPLMSITCDLISASLESIRACVTRMTASLDKAG